MFPLNGSVTRRLASLRRIPRGSVLRLPRYYQGAPTPAARPAPLPFVRQAVPRTTARREAAGSCRFRLLVGTAAGASIRRLRLALVETCGFSQVPRQPLCEHALLFDPGGPDAPRPLTTHPMLPSARLTASAPRSVTFRGSITQPVRSLSTLHGSDCSDSNTAQDSLPTGGQPWWGRTLTC